MTSNFLISNVDDKQISQSTLGICAGCLTIVYTNKRQYKYCSCCRKVNKRSNGRVLIFNIKHLIRDFFNTHFGKKSLFTFKIIELFLKKVTENVACFNYSDKNLVWYIEYNDDLKNQIFEICQNIMTLFNKKFLKFEIDVYLEILKNNYQTISFAENNFYCLVTENTDGNASRLPSFHMSRKNFLQQVSLDLTFFDDLD